MNQFDQNILADNAAKSNETMTPLFIKNVKESPILTF